MSCLVIGEALVDVIHAPDGSFARHPGGSMLNVAIGLRKLGRTVRLVTDFGLDDDGGMLAEYAASNGLELWLRSDSLRTNPTSTASVTLDEAGAVGYDFDFSWDIQDTPQSGACKLDLEVLAPPDGRLRIVLHTRRARRTEGSQLGGEAARERHCLLRSEHPCRSHQ